MAIASAPAHSPPDDAREKWAILCALSGAIGRALPFDSLAQLRQRMRSEHRMLSEVETVAKTPRGELGADGLVAATAFGYPIGDFYRTDPISRASPTMPEWSALFATRSGGPDR